MKKVVSGEYLQNKMREAINLLCNTVKCTLGPKGNNVIIDHSSFSPFITNDGVTIASNIQSDDEVVNVILELAKEASIKTNQVVGDGTTTTLVILQGLFNLSLDYINSGVSSIVLKRKLDEYLEQVLNLLEKEKIDTNSNMINNIARISSNDDSIAKIVSEVFLKVPNKDAVTIKEVEENLIDVKYYKGYTFQSVLGSHLFFNNSNSINYSDSLFLIVDDVINDIDNLGDILNEVMKSMKPLIVVAKDFSDYFVNDIVSYVLSNELKCVLLKVNEYGMRHRNVLKDLEIISGAKIINKEIDIRISYTGVVKSVYINNEETRIDFSTNKSIDNYVLSIKEELNEVSDEYVKEFYNKRLAMFSGYTACIIMGAKTKTELRERRMRLEDALCSVYSSKRGVLIGGGLSLLKISSKISGNSEAEKIWKKVLELPFEQLMLNSGLESDYIKKELEKNNFNLVYNLYSEEFENIDNTCVVDAYEVVANSLVSACSIATMLITTNSLVINEQLNNLNKINDYSNI